MDTPSEKFKPYYGSRSGPFLAVLRTIQGLFSKLTGIFKLTDEELSNAGVYLGGEGRE
jgi:hypothetical protein